WDGTKYALLEGRRDVAGEAFTYAFFLPGGFFDPPHWHTADARICVLRGTLHLGYGEQYDARALQAFEAGTYLVVPAGAPHFDGAHEDTLIIGTAEGLWATHYVDHRVQPSAGTPRTAP
ncbi:MAG: DUF4437 domain-containing protein, partial [Bacteroidetes bacterium]|nr:DUF4437 domain-containing protein [Bacteroidota bacterium]